MLHWFGTTPHTGVWSSHCASISSSLWIKGNLGFSQNSRSCKVRNYLLKQGWFINTRCWYPHEKLKQERILLPRRKSISGRKITYDNLVCDYWKLKYNPYSIRLKLAVKSFLNPQTQVLLLKPYLRWKLFSGGLPIYLRRYQRLFSLITHGMLQIH